MEEQGPPAPGRPPTDGTQPPPAPPDPQWHRPPVGQPQWQQPQWLQPVPWQSPPAWQQPPAGWQPPPGYPPVNWEPQPTGDQLPPFTAPPAKLKPWAIVLIIVVGMLLSTAGYVVYMWRVVDSTAKQVAALDDDRWNAPPTRPTEVAPTPQTSEPSAPSEPAGPRASTYPVRDDKDLARVCDGWYYPQSPKFAGKAPHQISVGVVDSVALPSRRILSSVSVPDLTESIWQAWIPRDPAKSQLVGCVDLVKTGGTAKSCKFDDPKPETVVMKKATYRVRLFEAATGKQLLDKASVNGEDEDCPSVVFLMGNESLLSQVGDRQLYEFYRPYVMKK
ncbi:hypothetical protein BJ973_009038 [Actinoplanes tereljensis]|uniref:Uncharacterized protein n=1 Tax=Paractinoplanes tereljensis TaxID=571912 RepID=A0A919NHB6_9ACTN|nr:hypothetical protein [Actinoplanes tereljensis]GIF17996.1 hypothetical protein Ate02nite_07260 [Actinoplanes tereljensis]